VRHVDTGEPDLAPIGEQKGIAVHDRLHGGGVERREFAGGFCGDIR
jgi:hypothetical protein